MRASLIFIGVVFLLLGALFLAIAGRPLLEDRRYQQQGVRTEAVATGKTLHRATADSGTAYEVSYRFRLPDGRAHARAEHVPVHVWEAVAVNATLTVEYLPGEPSSSRIVVGGAERESVTLWLVLGGVLVLGGLAAIKRSFRHVSVETPSTELSPPIAVAQEPSYWPLARRSMGFWFGAIALSVGLTQFLGGGWQLYEDVMFPREANATQGIVLTKDIKRSGRQNRTRRYEATYRYTAAGNTFEGRDQLSVDRWQQLVESEPVDVLYRPADPRVSRLAGPRPWLAKIFIAVLGALFTGIGGTFFFGAVRRARLEWRLRQGGVPASATIVELRERNVIIDGVRQWRLHYQYRDLRGEVHDNTLDVPEDEAQQWTVGQAGKVLYDSARPSEAVWIGRD